MCYFVKSREESVELTNLKNKSNSEKSSFKNNQSFLEKVTRNVKKNWLIYFIWILALVLRVIAAILSKGYVHPDEHYQSIEVVYEKIFGLGFIPWEFEEGARSWVYPGIVFIIFKLFLALGITNIENILIGVRLFSGLLSMIPVILSYYLGKIFFDKKTGLFGSFFIAIWYEFIFWATRTMSDSLAMNFLFVSVFFSMMSAKKQPEKKVKENQKFLTKDILWGFLAGIFLGLAFMFKFSVLIIGLPIFALFLAKKKWKVIVFFIFGTIIIIICQGLIDLFTWGSFLHSSIEFFKYNIISSESAVHGEEHFLSYIAFFAYYFSSYALLYLLFIVIGTEKEWKSIFLLTTSIFFVLVFSFITHKEWRFILPILPLLSIVVVRGMVKFPKFINKKELQHGIFASIILVTVYASAYLGIVERNFQPKNNFCESFKWIGQQQEIDNVYIIGYLKFEAPGYTYLGVNVTLYFTHKDAIEPIMNLKPQNDTYYFVISSEKINNESSVRAYFNPTDIVALRSFPSSQPFTKSTIWVVKAK